MMQEDEKIYEASGVIEESGAEVVEVEIFEAFQAPTTDSSFNHALLTNREIHDAHPITAITGLREELNEIEALKTIYSDKYNIANYYKWNENATYDIYGYFVSIVSGTSEIKICENEDIFGVSVDRAGFIGGQDAIPRGNDYGLIVTSGLVNVRCELEVKVGDYVISNDKGYATKSGSDYGYKVLALAKDTTTGDAYAIISLDVQADRTNALGVGLQELAEQVDINEKNIVSAINVANQAYNKSQEATTISEDALREALTAMNKSSDAEGRVNDMEEVLASVSSVSTQARAIAESAVTSAISIKNEAVNKANEALAENSELRREFEAKIAEIDTELNNTALELESAKEDILETKEELQQSVEDVKEDLNVANNEIKNDIANTKADLNTTKAEILSLQESLSPLTSWPEDSDSPTGVAGFVAKADEESVILGGLVEWQGETNESIAAFQQEVADNYATQEMVSIVGDNLSLFKQEVSDTYATQEMVSAVEDNLTEYKQEVTDTYATQEMVSSVDDALTSYKQEVSENYATQQMLTSVEDNIASFQQEVGDTYATQEMVTTVGDALTTFKQEVEDGYATQEMVTSVDDALTSYKQEVADSYATQQMLTSVEDNLTSYKQEVTDTYATQQMVTSVGDSLTSYKQEVADTYATQEMVTNVDDALTSYKQEVTDSYATQTMVTAVDDALASYKQEVTDTYATNVSLATLRTETTNAITASEEKATATYASKSDLTSFESDTNIAMARIEQKADANGAYIQSTVSNMNRYAVGLHSQAYGFTLEQAASVLEDGMIYVPTEEVTETYKYVDDDKKEQAYERSFLPGYLYKWGELTDYPYGWTTVDKDYNSLEEINDSTKAVYFTTEEPAVSDNFGYWYTNGDTITGTTGTYEPYTLYKWTSYEDEAGATQYHWVAVATLTGNSQNRAVSQIRQDANSIELRVTNAEGAYAGIKEELDGVSSKVNSIAAWPSNTGDDKYNMAILQEYSDDDNAYMTLATIRNVTSEDGTIVSELENIGGAKIVLADTEDGSYIQFDADKINFTADDYAVIAENITLNASQIAFVDEEGNATTIDGNHITTGSITTDQIATDTITADKIAANAITADKIAVDAIRSRNYYEVDEDGNLKTDDNGNYVRSNPQVGMKLDLSKGTWDSFKFKIDEKGKITATGGNIGTWAIGDFEISRGDAGMYAGLTSTKDSLVSSNTSPVRFYCGATDNMPNTGKFTVLEDGSLYANAVKLGDGGLGDNDSVFLSTTNIEGAGGFFEGDATTQEDGTVVRADNKIDNWRMTVGSNFGVTSDGSLYANNAQITGVITAQQGGHISGWDISDNCLTGQSKYKIKSGNGYASWIQDVELSPTGLRVWRGSVSSGSNKGQANYQASVPWLYLIWRFDDVINQINKIAKGETPSTLENLYDWEDIE